MDRVKSRGLYRRKKILPYLFISPFFIFYGLFGLFPLIYGMVFSMWRKAKFNGLGNYVRILTDERFWKSMENAFVYMLGSNFIIIPIACIAGLFLFSDRLEKGRGFISTLFFIPSVTSVIVAGLVFKFLLKTDHGVFNVILQGLRLIKEPIQFLVDPAWGIPSLLLICIWRYFGVNSIYFLAGLQGVPRELREAARIDGASGATEFFRVTLPLLKPILSFIVFQSVVGSFSMFGEIYTLQGQGGTGANDSMLFPVIFLYNKMFVDNQMNQAAAMGYILAIFLLALTLAQRRIFREVADA